MSPTTKKSSQPTPCVERGYLSDSYIDAVGEFVRLTLAQVDAVLAGNETSFVKEIRDAGQRKDAAKSALIHHHRQHGCRPIGAEVRPPPPRPTAILKSIKETYRH